jgi:hypothetical protein
VLNGIGGQNLKEEIGLEAQLRWYFAKVLEYRRDVHCRHIPLKRDANGQHRQLGRIQEHPRIRKTHGGAACLRIYPENYTATVLHFQNFALIPSGIVVGSWEHEACYRLAATVPFSVVRPYFNKLGLSLAAGVRRPR